MKALPEPGSPQPKVDPSDFGGPPFGFVPGGDPLDWLFLATAHDRLGRTAEARKWLDKAVAAIDRATRDPPDGSSLDSRIDCKARLSYQVLRREAEGMIGLPAPVGPARHDALIHELGEVVRSAFSRIGSAAGAAPENGSGPIGCRSPLLPAIPSAGPDPIRSGRRGGSRH